MPPAPMPLIVGAPRSGTTLLRLMLDAHPALAIPPETGFLPNCAKLAEDQDAGPAALARLLLGYGGHAGPRPDFGIAPDRLGAALGEVAPFSVADGVRAFYRIYAARHGKARWGDKTPGHVFAIPAIAALLPEARFIHLIRDGRAAAASIRPLWFAPSHDIAVLAGHWRDAVRAGLDAARAGYPVLELRYEALLADPAAVLQRACAFIGLDYDNAMLRYHERAAQRLTEHQGRMRADGTVLVSREQRLAQQALVSMPPRIERAEAWRDILTPQEVAAFQSAAGELLQALGYRRH